MTLTWLADELRRAGLTVVEHPGWRTHARPGDWSPRFGLIHATAAPRTQADDTQVRIVRDGRSDLPGPIANACVDRRGRWHVLSAGRCNSTLTGTAGPSAGLGNTHALSTEACNDNGLHSPPEEWPEVQYRSYAVGWAAWCRRLGWAPARLVGHKEHTPGRKTDPSFSMARFRADVATVLAGGEDSMSTKAEQQIAELHEIVTRWRSGMPTMADGKRGIEPVRWRIRDEEWQTRVTGLLTALSGQIGGLDTAAVIAHLDRLAAEERERDAELAELVRQVQSGELAAEQFVDELARRLATAPDPTVP